MLWHSNFSADFGEQRRNVTSLVDVVYKNTIKKIADEIHWKEINRENSGVNKKRRKNQGFEGFGSQNTLNVHCIRRTHNIRLSDRQGVVAI